MLQLTHHPVSRRMPRSIAIVAVLLATGLLASCGVSRGSADPSAASLPLTMPRIYGTAAQGIDCSTFIADPLPSPGYGASLRPGVTAGAVPLDFDPVTVTWCGTPDDEATMPDFGGPVSPVEPTDPGGPAFPADPHDDEPQDGEPTQPLPEPSKPVNPDGSIRTSTDVEPIVEASQRFETRLSSTIMGDCADTGGQVVEPLVFVTDAEGWSVVVGWPRHHDVCGWEWITDPAEVLAEVFDAEPR